LVRASEILSDDATREEYNKLLVEGVPWHEKYYGQYAHKYGAPDHDIRYVVAGLVTFISILQYAYKYHSHFRYIELAKRTNRYRQAAKKLEFEREQKRKLRTSGAAVEEDEEGDDDEDGPKVTITGAEKPSLWDVFAVKLVLSPYLVTKGIHSFFTGPPYDHDAAMRLKSGMTEEEWEHEKSLAEARRERMMSSGKYKKYKRWMSKNR